MWPQKELTAEQKEDHAALYCHLFLCHTCYKSHDKSASSSIVGLSFIENPLRFSTA